MISIDLVQHVDVNKRIAALREKEITQSVKPDEALHKGIVFHQDGEHPRNTEVTSPKGDLLRLKASENLKSRWTVMHFHLGKLDLSKMDVAGVVIRSRSHGLATVSKICLRSGNGDTFSDYYFPKHLVSSAAEGSHLDALDLSKIDDIPRTAQWRDLVIFFSDRDVDVTLHNLRFFVV